MFGRKDIAEIGLEDWFNGGLTACTVASSAFADSGMTRVESMILPEVIPGDRLFSGTALAYVRNVILPKATNVERFFQFGMAGKHFASFRVSVPSGASLSWFLA